MKRSTFVQEKYSESPGEILEQKDKYFDYWQILLSLNKKTD